MGDDYAGTAKKATAEHRLKDLQSRVHSLDVQMGQLEGSSVSNDLLNELTACIKASMRALTALSVDKAKQDLAQAQKVIERATQFINHLESKPDEEPG